jgi:drug/metabolite transporter (DMT)-like permease
MPVSGIKRAMGSAEWAMLLTLSVLWGGSFLFVAVAVKELPPFTLVVLRVGLAAVALHIVLRAAGIPLPRGRAVWSAFFVMGLLNNALPFSLIAWGQSHIASGLAAILNATTPLFTVIVAHYWTSDEKATARHVVGVAIGFLGVIVMVGSTALTALGVDVLAQASVLAASVLYAITGVYGRRFKAMGVAPLATAAGMLTASSVILFPVALIVDRPWTLPMPHAPAIAAVLSLALASTAFAYILYFRLLATAGATNLLLVTFLLPVSANLLGATLLGERLEVQHFAGMALIGLGLGAIDGRLLQLGKRLVSGTPAQPRSD